MSVTRLTYKPKPEHEIVTERPTQELNRNRYPVSRESSGNRQRGKPAHGAECTTSETREVTKLRICRSVCVNNGGLMIRHRIQECIRPRW